MLMTGAASCGVSHTHTRAVAILRRPVAYARPVASSYFTHLRDVSPWGRMSLVKRSGMDGGDGVGSVAMATVLLLVLLLHRTIRSGAARLRRAHMDDAVLRKGVAAAVDRSSDEARRIVDERKRVAVRKAMQQLCRSACGERGFHTHLTGMHLQR